MGTGVESIDVGSRDDSYDWSAQALNIQSDIQSDGQPDGQSDDQPDSQPHDQFAASPSGADSSESLHLTPFTDSDLQRLTDCLGDCLDSLIDAEDFAKMASGHADLDPTYLAADDFAFDSDVSVNPSNCPGDDDFFAKSNARGRSRWEKQGLVVQLKKEGREVEGEQGLMTPLWEQGDSQLVPPLCDPEQSVATPLWELPLWETHKMAENQTHPPTESPMGGCLSPSASSSSGCESDFASTCGEERFSSRLSEEEPFRLSEDAGFLDFSDEQFTELFPALY
jgi:hypothetical protein